MNKAELKMEEIDSSVQHSFGRKKRKIYNQSRTGIYFRTWETVSNEN
jgi:hypothetical protein